VQPTRIAGYGKYLALAYSEKNYIVVVNVVTGALIKQFTIDEPFTMAGELVLNLGPIMTSKRYESDEEDVPEMFKLSYVAQDETDATLFYMNEVHFILMEDEDDDSYIINVDKAISFAAAQKDVFTTEYYFTGSGSSFVFSESAEAFVPSIYLQGSFDQLVKMPSSRRRLSILSAEETVTDFEPAQTLSCSPYYGVANPFANKFQASSCQHCTEIYKNAMDKEDETGVEQSYDIFVAKTLCDDSQLDIGLQQMGINLIVIGAFIFVAIVLFTFLVFCVKPENPLKMKIEKADGAKVELALSRLPMTPPPVFNPPAPVVKKEATPAAPVNGISKTAENDAPASDKEDKEATG